MEKMKSKIVAAIGGLGALCIACCSLPIMALVGLGSLEAFFCESVALRWLGIAMVAGAVGWFAFKKWRQVNAGACILTCACKTK